MCVILFVLFVCFSSMSVYADLYKPVYMKEYACDQSRILVADLSKMNRREIKTGYFLKSEPYSLALKNIKSMQQTIRIISFRDDDSFTRVTMTLTFYSITTNLRRFINERTATNIRDSHPCSVRPAA